MLYFTWANHFNNDTIFSAGETKALPTNNAAREKTDIADIQTVSICNLFFNINTPKSISDRWCINKFDLIWLVFYLQSIMINAIG